ncbi:hypothetical protein ABLI39_07765 [Pseudarthrobacter sp. B907]|uniref:hypothetical protein n=1 Tax=Pseudarthrobacter sp. B907 TaxID=3158261 RepID=UPI0032DBD0B4
MEMIRCAPSRSPFAARYAGDSGRNLKSSGTTATRGMPPRASIPWNPREDRKASESRAARMPPTAYPENMRALLKLRRFDFENSTVKAMAVGITPPRPRPARKRKSPNSSGVGAHAVSSIRREKEAMDTIMIFRRPTMSVR